MIRRYTVERQAIHWKHVAGDQWTCVVRGTAEGYGEFHFPHAGVFVVDGREQIRKFVENWASNKAVIDLFGKN